MAFGDTAKAALEMAHNAYKSSIEMAQTVKGFEGELERQDRRTKEELLAQERRLIDKLSEFRGTLTDNEKRLRELERENADLRGKVASLEHLRDLEGKHATLQGQVTALEQRVNTLVLEAMQSVLRDPERLRKTEGTLTKTPGDGHQPHEIPLYKLTTTTE